MTAAGRHHWIVVGPVLTMLMGWFAPVIFAGKVFVSDNTMPGFFLPVQLWSDALYSGFPIFADPTFANAYPIRILWSSISGLIGKANAYNAYVCSAFAIAAVGAYAYAVEVTDSRLAGAVTAVAFACCGFMQIHLGHETITHTAAWLPAAVWATHRVMVRGSGRDVACLALFAALTYLANHPQIALQVGLVSSLYALALFTGSPHPVRTLFRFAGAWILGLAMVVWHIVPSWENGSLSMRGAPPTTPGLEGSVPLDQVIHLAAPWIFGGYPGSAVAPVAAFGDKMFEEVANYVAAPTLMLALVAIVGWRHRIVLFWAIVALLFFILSLGPQTILGEARFFAPVFNLFATPARDILTVHFALAILAGVGASIVARGEIDGRRVRTALLLGLLPTALAVLLYPTVVRKAAAAGVALPVAWKNVALVAPVVLAAAAVAAIALSHRFRPAAAPLLLATLVAGCGYFGWFAGWRLYSGPANAALDEPPAVAEVRNLDNGTAGRVAVADGWVGPAGFIPNSSMMFGIPNVGGYGPLLPRRYATVMRITNSGWMKPDMFSDANLALDLVGARWAFPHRQLGPRPKPTHEHGIPWAPTPLDHYLGGSCMGTPLDSAIAFRLPQPMQVSRIVLVTTLGCGTEVTQGAELARVRLTGDGAASEGVAMQAGRDSSEWSIECGAGKSSVAHDMAKPFDSRPAPGGGAGCVGHHYLADLPVGGPTGSAVRIEWTGQQFARAMMHLKHVTVFDAAGVGHPLDAGDLVFANERRWKRHVLAGGVEAFENLRAFPRAWLAGEVTPLTEEQEIAAVYSGRLPNGEAFDPRRRAITSDAAAIALAPGPARPVTDGTVTTEEWDGASRRFAIQSAAPVMLVVSGRFHPGWTAQVDGESRSLIRVDGILQGVQVPAGRHEVRLDYRPRHFGLLLAIGGGALVFGALLCRRRAISASYASTKDVP